MKTVIQAAIIIILFIGFSGAGIHIDGETSFSTLMGGPIPWIIQKTPGGTSINLLYLTLDVLLITFMSEFFVYGTSRMGNPKHAEHA